VGLLEVHRVNVYVVNVHTVNLNEASEPNLLQTHLSPPPNHPQTNLGRIIVIGKFEELALLALVRAGPNAYAAQVFKEMKALENVRFSALYTTLDRMAKKKLVSEAAQPDDAGRRLFTITGAGRLALKEALSATKDLGGFALPEAGLA